MKRRDKGWGEADSQRAQSTSQPKSPRLELTGRPAGAVHLHVYFTHHVGGYRNLAVLGQICPFTELTLVSAAFLTLRSRDSKRDAIPCPVASSRQRPFQDKGSGPAGCSLRCARRMMCACSYNLGTCLRNGQGLIRTAARH
jgi:hypothetical protein